MSVWSKLTQSILRIHNKEALRIEARSDQKHYQATSEAGGLSFLVFLTTSQHSFCQITECQGSLFPFTIVLLSGLSMVYQIFKSYWLMKKSLLFTGTRIQGPARTLVCNSMIWRLNAAVNYDPGRGDLPPSLVEPSPSSGTRGRRWNGDNYFCSAFPPASSGRLMEAEGLLWAEYFCNAGGYLQAAHPSWISPPTGREEVCWGS